ncbi:MAG: 2Fe-2S iron-sulfur cluster-binding protein, partial [Kiritimatiellia bacterium]
MKHDIQLTVNGIPRNLTVTADDTLLRVLREELHLTGAKKGCGEGECGACTIIMNGEAIRACLVLAVEANGADILTIEGITPPNGITRVQQAFIEADAVQCGFCT